MSKAYAEGQVSSVGKKNVNIRVATIADLSAIVDIYNEAVLAKYCTADTQVQRVEDRLQWFREHAVDAHPVFVAEAGRQVVGWCSLSAYRFGRSALRATAEISYYVARARQRQGVATALVSHAFARCPALRLKTLIAIVLEGNSPSLKLLGDFGFERWGFLPGVADFDGMDMGHVYLGKKVPEQH